MKSNWYLIVCLLFLGSMHSIWAQEEQNDKPEIQVVDSLYREDQFYFTFTYDSANKVKGLSQNKFSPGISLGFLRDFPVNKARTYAIAIGMGYNLSVFNHNVYQYANTTGVGTSYQYEFISSDTYYQKNKLTLHTIELPIEFRWRASTEGSHKFWRIYTGFKVGYVVSDRYRFQNDVQNVLFKNNSDLQRIQYGCYISTGWNTWNFYAYYGLNSLYKNATVSGKPLEPHSLNIGLQFYIL
ncbi:MAG: porin family protein [Flavobacterium stagni]